MIKFQRSLMIDATVDEVWAVLERFMHIDEFAPQIARVEALSQNDAGLGAKRRNIFENGGSMVEEVIAWTPKQSFTVRLSEMDNMPLKAAQSTTLLTSKGGKTQVTWGFDYQVKFGPLGWVLGKTLMKMMMGKVIDANLKGLDALVQKRRLA